MTQAASKSDLLFARLRDDILTLDLPPGAALRLPALSAHYGTGLTPLRECLNRLVSDQLVVPEHNRGFFVAPLTRTDLLDLECSRTAIEGAMFAQSMTTGGDTWEAGVVGAYHHLSQTPVPSVLQDAADLALWSVRHDRFHAALLDGAASRWMHRFAEQTAAQLGRYQRFIQVGLQDLAATAPHVAIQAADVFATAMALEPHRVLYDAALARDIAAGQQAFDAHAQLTLSAFTQLTEMLPDNTPLAATLGLQAEGPK